MLFQRGIKERATRAASSMSPGSSIIADDGDATPPVQASKTRLMMEGWMVALYGKLTLLGASPGGEKWSCTFTFDPDGASGTWDQAAGDAQAAAALAVVLPNNLKLGMSTALSLTGVRWEGRDTSTDALIGVSIATAATPQTGIGSPVLPLQCATVFSLRTPAPGPRGRGRIYWPAVGLTITSACRMNPTDQTAILTAFKSYVGLLQTALTSSGVTGQHLSVRSRTGHTTSRVNRVQLGDIIDTQRRRRDSLPENYANVSFP